MRELFLAVALAGCGPAPEPGHPTPPPPKPAPIDPAACPPRVDVADLFARHASAYGSVAATRAALPRSFRGELTINGTERGRFERIVDVERSRDGDAFGPLHTYQGIDERGAWTLGLTRVLVRLRPEETLEFRIGRWLDHRLYLEAKPPEISATCAVEDGRARDRVAIDHAEIGRPTLTFDHATAALLGVAYVGDLGHAQTITVERWGPPDARGVRWPHDTTGSEPGGNVVVSHTLEERPGIACSDFGARQATGNECLASPRSKLEVAWPPEGPVVVPMRSDQGELEIEIGVEGRKVWALLDSGAGLTTLDARAPAAASFRSALSVEGTGSTQSIKLGLGEIGEVEFGAMKLRHLAVASVPIPAFDAFGARKPEMILGTTMFLLGVVRVDYVKNAVTLAPSGTSLARPEAKRLSIEMLRDSFVARGVIEGHAAPLVVDTGNSGMLDVFTAWSSANGLPGDRPTSQRRGQFGAGEGETTLTYFRVNGWELGPLSFGDTQTSMSDVPRTGDLAGLVGNLALSRCPAVIFDVEARTVWLEGPCDRKIALP